MHFVLSHPCAAQILHHTSIEHLYQHCTNSAQKYLANTTSAIFSVDVDVDVDHQWLESDTQSSETLLAAHPLALRLGCGL